MCGKYDRLYVWKRYAHIVALLSRCPSLVKISDNALVVDQSARTANTNERHTTSKLCVTGLNTASGTKGLKLVLQLKRLMSWHRPVSSANNLSLKVLTCTVLTVVRDIYEVTSQKCTKAVTHSCIGEKGNGSRLFAV